MSVIETLEASPPSQPAPPDRNRTGLWIALGVLIAICLALFIGAVALGLGASSDDEAQSTAGVEASATSASGDQSIPAQPATTTGAAATSVPATAATASNEDAAALLIGFGKAWETADWGQMETMASGQVVDVAKEWYQEGGSIEITQDNLNLILDGCWESAPGATSCDVLYAPSDGHGLIFSVVYVDTADGLRVDDLVFGGDAG